MVIDKPQSYQRYMFASIKTNLDQVKIQWNPIQRNNVDEARHVGSNVTCRNFSAVRNRTVQRQMQNPITNPTS